MNEKVRIKKISIVLYCNNNFDETKESLYSIIDQNINHLFYDVFIINDDAKKNFSSKLKEFLNKEGLSNFYIFSLDNYNGLALSFGFLLKNKIIKTKYVTLMKSGDVLKEGWISEFLENQYHLNKDLYMWDLKDMLFVPNLNAKKKEKTYDLIKSEIIISDFDKEDTIIDDAFSTKPVFLGKIWKMKNIENIVVSDNKILFQEIFIYIQMVLKCSSFWHEHKIAGTIKHKTWIPEILDKKRIELLSSTISKSISWNDVANGHLLQLLALAILNTPKDFLPIYSIKNYERLKSAKIIKTYNLSPKKVIELTKQFIEFGDYKFERVKQKNKLRNVKS